MAWRVARSLDTLLAQLNALAPKRSKASDGGVGDLSHSTRASDHNPATIAGVGPGIVTARDFTHDPAGGLDCHKLANTLVQARDLRLKYVIWNRRIIDSRAGNNQWTWQPYSGVNPHTKHLHLSVMPNSSCDSTVPWVLPGLVGPPTSDVLSPGSSGPAVTALQERLNSWYPSYSKLAVDGVYGPATEAVVREFQRRSGLAVDGIAGPATLAALHLAV